MNKHRLMIVFTFLLMLIGTNGLHAEAAADQEAENEIEIQKSSTFLSGILSLFFTDEEEPPVEEENEKETEAEETEPPEKEEEPEPEPEPEEEDTSEKFVLPAEGRMSSPYGYRIHPIHKVEKLHAGMDIAGGGPIVAVQNGTVTRARYDKGWGWYVKIDHGDGLQTLYAHMQKDSLKVKEGDTVDQGQEIGTMGTTGASTGVHLHFEVYVEDTQVDPAEYFELD